MRISKTIAAVTAHNAQILGNKKPTALPQWVEFTAVF
jgi:hypothetical protein